jgi:GNAT acetyltransferase-like protein
MAQIRAFVEGDIPRVARLHRAVFKTRDHANAESLDAYHDYFTRVFLNCPLRDSALPCLVYEDGDRIVGFLGVMPRRMAMRGRHFQAAISSQFVVDPAARAGLVAMRLARTFLEGPQDLSISDEASDIARKIWEGLGGMTALLRSLHWTRPLRPATLAISTLQARPRLAPLAVSARPVAMVVDAMATRLPQSHFHQVKPDGSDAETLTEQAVLDYISDRDASGSLHVEYDEQTLRWLLEQARRRRAGGSLHAAVIKRHGRTLGWYFYHHDRDRAANVLHFASTRAGAGDVLAHLFYQASEHGAIAATGRLEPRFLQAFSDNYCLFHRRGPWVLLNSKRSDLVRSFETEDALFSRFDGEWCLGY